MGKPKIIFKNIYLWGLKGFSFRFPPSGGKPRLLQGWILGMQPQHSQLFVELGNFIVPRQGQGAVTSQMGLGGADNSRGENPIGNGNSRISSPPGCCSRFGAPTFPNPRAQSRFSQNPIVQHQQDPEFPPWENQGIPVPGGKSSLLAPPLP